MKILFITSNTDVDYLHDCVFNGLIELYGDDVIDTKYLWFLSKITHEQQLKLYGNGFTVSNNLPDRSYIDRSNIKEKILSRYFDIIVYGSIWRGNDYLEEVLNTYPKEKIIVLDGEDSNKIYKNLNEKTLYFKRELLNETNGCYPISFAIPEYKFVDKHKVVEKSLFDSEQKATFLGKSGYHYTDENEYYQGYQKSYFGETRCKGGWDCLRHYEIIANYCLPHFINYREKPKNIMVNWPTELQNEANFLYDNFDKEKYTKCLDEFYEYAKNNLTTKCLAKYILNKTK